MLKHRNYCTRFVTRYSTSFERKTNTKNLQTRVLEYLNIAFKNQGYTTEGQNFKLLASLTE